MNHIRGYGANMRRRCWFKKDFLLFHLISLPRAAMAEREMSTCIQTGDVVTHKSWILLRINKARIILCDSYSWNVAKKKKEKEEDSSQSNATVGGMCHLSENQKKKKMCFCVCQPASIIMKTKSTTVAFPQKYQSFPFCLLKLFFFFYILYGKQGLVRMYVETFPMRLGLSSTPKQVF